MRITTHQISQLDDGLWQHLETELMLHLHENHRDALDGYTDAELNLMVHAAVAQARAHKMAHWDTIFTFAAYMFEIAPDFFLHPVCRAALSRKGYGDRDRLELLFQSMTDADWDAAEGEYEANEWVMRAQGLIHRYGSLN